ncbi:MAG: hypothetical protein KBC33_01165 [Candidatus Pacebacteria bacterium]|nr:hypothetical protein [Candidatus Paceibacterota bacterium]
MSLEYIFPDHTKRNRTIAIVVECVAAFLAIGLIVWAVWYYRAPQEPAPAVVQEPVKDLATQRQEWLDQPNIGTPITGEQLEQRKAFVEKSSSASSATPLTPEQIKARQSWVENI